MKPRSVVRNQTCSNIQIWMQNYLVRVMIFHVPENPEVRIGMNSILSTSLDEWLFWMTFPHITKKPTGLSLCDALSGYLPLQVISIFSDHLRWMAVFTYHYLGRQITTIGLCWGLRAERSCPWEVGTKIRNVEIRCKQKERCKSFSLVLFHEFAFIVHVEWFAMRWAARTFTYLNLGWLWFLRSGVIFNDWFRIIW